MYSNLEIDLNLPEGNLRINDESVDLSKGSDMVKVAQLDNHLDYCRLIIKYIQVTPPNPNDTSCYSADKEIIEGLLRDKPYSDKVRMQAVPEHQIILQPQGLYRVQIKHF